MKSRKISISNPGWFRPVRIMMLFLLLMIGLLLWTYPGYVKTSTTTEAEAGGNYAVGAALRATVTSPAVIRVLPAVPTTATAAAAAPVAIDPVAVLPAVAAPRKKIAYAITVTRDGPFVDGALV